MNGPFEVPHRRGARIGRVFDERSWEK